MLALEYYPALKRSKIMNFSGKSMKVAIILSEVTETQKDKCCMFYFITISWFQTFICEYISWSNCKIKKVIGAQR